MRLAAAVALLSAASAQKEPKKPAKIEVNFKNDANVSFALMWIPPTQTINEARDVGELPALGKTVQNTFVGHRFQLQPKAAVEARFDAVNGFLTGSGDLQVGEMTLDEAKTRCKAQASCMGFTYKGDKNLKGRAQIFLKDHFNVRTSAEGQPVTGWSSYRKTSIGNAKGPGAQMPRAVDIVCKGSGQVVVGIQGDDIMVSGNAVTRKLFRPLVALAPAPPVAPLSQNDTTLKPVPPPQPDAELEGETTNMRPPENEGARLFYQQRPAKVDMINQVDRPVQMFWLDTRSPIRRPMPALRPGRLEHQSTFVGHRFEVHVKDLPSKIITIRDDGVAYVSHNGKEVLVEGTPVLDKPAKYRGPKWTNITTTLKQTCESAFEAFPADKDYFCHAKFDYRPVTMAQFDSRNVSKRVVQAQQRRLEHVEANRRFYKPMTDTGFLVTRLPKVAMERLGSFVNVSRHTAKPSEVDWDSPSTDDTWSLPLTGELSWKVQHMMRDAMAAWSGVDRGTLRAGKVSDLKLHHHGSKVWQHADSSHPLTAILEVARNDANDTADWPLIVTDHSGKEHTIPATVGNLILFESSVVAARREAFAGRQFTTLSVHFSPGDWPTSYFQRSDGIAAKLDVPAEAAQAQSGDDARRTAADWEDFDDGDSASEAAKRPAHEEL